MRLSRGIFWKSTVTRPDVSFWARVRAPGRSKQAMVNHLNKVLRFIENILLIKTIIPGCGFQECIFLILSNAETTLADKLPQLFAFVFHSEGQRRLIVDRIIGIP